MKRGEDLGTTSSWVSHTRDDLPGVLALGGWEGNQKARVPGRAKLRAENLTAMAHTPHPGSPRSAGLGSGHPPGPTALLLWGFSFQA